MLKPVDIFVLLRLSLEGGQRPAYSELARELRLAPSEVHSSVRRAKESHLFYGEGKEARVNRSTLLEFLLHGIRYAFPSRRGAITRGTPTGYAAPPLNTLIVQGDEAVPVWPDPHGKVRGYALAPLHKSVSGAALKSQALYELLALVDAMRDGSARERSLASKELTQRLKGGVHATS